MTVAHSCRTAMKLPELLAAGRSGGTASLLQFPAILLSHLQKTPRRKPRRSARLVAPSPCGSRGELGASERGGVGMESQEPSR